MAGMSERLCDRIAAGAAGVVAALSIVYAVAYLIVTPAAQRGSDTAAFARSYLAHPAGLRIASACLAAAGIAGGIAAVAVAGRVIHQGSARMWVSAAAVIAGLAQSAHGLGDLVSAGTLAHRYVSGGAGTRAAVSLERALPSPVDPRGLATFGVAGLVALALGFAVRGARPRLGVVGIILGADLFVLFAATATGVRPLVLASGGAASLILVPAWWAGLARLLWQAHAPEPNTAAAVGYAARA
jgi:hypothetical protein